VRVNKQDNGQRRVTSLEWSYSELRALSLLAIIATVVIAIVVVGSFHPDEAANGCCRQLVESA